MDINFCYRCGSKAVPGSDRCPNCGAFYDGRDKYGQSSYQQYYNNQIPLQQPKKSSNSVVVVIIVIFAVLFILGILAAIIVPAMIGYTARQKKYNTARLSSEYSYAEENEEIQNNYSGHITLDDLESIYEFNDSRFDGTYTDDEGQYERYTYEDMTFDIYENEGTDYIKEIKFSYNDSSSSWIKENDLYDSILQNEIATLIEICGYSWGEAQDYLDGFSLTDGMDETDPNGYHFYLDSDSPEISFTITMPE